MSNRKLVELFGAQPSFQAMMECAANCEEGKYEGLKTFFTRYRNPIGIEIEMENYREGGERGLNFWRAVPDGSLRNNGMEFVSKPLAGRYIDFAIAEVAQFLKTQKISWSHRTSIHVHNNMSTMTGNHLTALVGLYGLYEDVFFSMVEPTRKGNPFCYPATSVDPQVYQRIHGDNKYCALNLAPLLSQATIEFRHMHGHDDWRLLRRWVQLIVKLHAFIENLNSREAVAEIKKVIDNGSYVHTFRECFGASAGLFDPNLVRQSGERNALWAATILNVGFE